MEKLISGAEDIPQSRPGAEKNEGIEQRPAVPFVTAENFAGEKVKAFAYFVLGTGDYPPSRRYMEKLISGAEEHNLSDPYIAQLEAIKTLG